MCLVPAAGQVSNARTIVARAFIEEIGERVTLIAPAHDRGQAGKTRLEKSPMRPPPGGELLIPSNGRDARQKSRRREERHERRTTTATRHHGGGTATTLSLDNRVLVLYLYETLAIAGLIADRVLAYDLVRRCAWRTDGTIGSTAVIALLVVPTTRLFLWSRDPSCLILVFGGLDQKSRTLKSLATRLRQIAAGTCTMRHDHSISPHHRGAPTMADISGAAPRLARLGRDLHRLTARCSDPARSADEAEERIAEGERIAAAVRACFRGATA